MRQLELNLAFFLFPYRPGFHVSPVPPLAILLLILITKLGCSVLDELKGLQYSAGIRELSFPVGQKLFVHYISVNVAHEAFFWGQKKF